MGRRAGGSPRVGLAGAGHLGHDRPDRAGSGFPFVKKASESSHFRALFPCPCVYHAPNPYIFHKKRRRLFGKTEIFYFFRIFSDTFAKIMLEWL